MDEFNTEFNLGSFDGYKSGHAYEMVNGIVLFQKKGGASAMKNEAA
jgi:hypothetical protein